MRILKDLLAKPDRAMVAVDVEALMRENVRLLVENTELKCRLAAGGNATARRSREKYRETANALAASLGKPLPFSGRTVE